jgi:hypothetical protein
MLSTFPISSPRYPDQVVVQCNVLHVIVGVTIRPLVRERWGKTIPLLFFLGIPYLWLMVYSLPIPSPMGQRPCLRLSQLPFFPYGVECMVLDVGARCIDGFEGLFRCGPLVGWRFYIMGRTKGDFRLWRDALWALLAIHS